MPEDAHAPHALTPAGVNAMLEAEFPGTGNVCVEVGATHALARREVDAGAIRPGGYVSGPTQFGLADAALWYLVFGVIGRVEPMALTSELSIRFLRPAQGSVLWARASLESAGSRSIVGSVRVWCDHDAARPSSVAQGTYVLPRG
ncbi:MAG TPA: PaaI family thioesterase [Acidimicrobiales bacterium]|nr:PaaI family thioesterase [Acidimicrobiales bacterium]